MGPEGRAPRCVPARRGARGRHHHRPRWPRPRWRAGAGTQALVGARTGRRLGDARRATPGCRSSRGTYVDSVAAAGGDRAMRDVGRGRLGRRGDGDAGQPRDSGRRGLRRRRAARARANDLVLAVRAGTTTRRPAARCAAGEAAFACDDRPRRPRAGAVRPPRDVDEAVARERRRERGHRVGAGRVRRARGAPGAVRRAARAAVQRQRARRRGGRAQGPRDRRRPAGHGTGRGHGRAGRRRAGLRQRRAPRPGRAWRGGRRRHGRPGGRRALLDRWGVRRVAGHRPRRARPLRRRSAGAWRAPAVRALAADPGDRRRSCWCRSRRTAAVAAAVVAERRRRRRSSPCSSALDAATDRGHPAAPRCEHPGGRRPPRRGARGRRRSRPTSSATCAAAGRGGGRRARRRRTLAGRGAVLRRDALLRGAQSSWGGALGPCTPTRRCAPTSACRRRTARTCCLDLGRGGVHPRPAAPDDRPPRRGWSCCARPATTRRSRSCCSTSCSATARTPTPPASSRRVLRRARATAGTAVVAYVLGTDADPQGYAAQRGALDAAGCARARRPTPGPPWPPPRSRLRAPSRPPTARDRSEPGRVALLTYSTSRAAGWCTRWRWPRRCRRRARTSRSSRSATRRPGPGSSGRSACRT